MGELIIVGDRVLIEPQDGEKQTESGLVLPATVAERDKVGSGRVIRVGPGYLTANPEYSEGEPWASNREAVRYLPLQAQPGDFAFFVRKEAVEITYEKTKYLIVHHSAILALVRPSTDDILSNIEDILEDED
ncbi:MAG: co-chaperone GroES family protein [Rhodothermales bacterium]|nr:co-chaperone GroES family protein [Rhodothermales bacterium]